MLLIDPATGKSLGISLWESVAVGWLLVSNSQTLS